MKEKVFDCVAKGLRRNGISKFIRKSLKSLIIQQLTSHAVFIFSYKKRKRLIFITQ